MFDFRQFSIISTMMDMELFFNKSYQDAVNKELNNLMEDYLKNNPDFDLKETPLSIVCNTCLIEIKDKRKNPSIYLFGILDEYKAEQNLTSFTF